MVINYNPYKSIAFLFLLFGFGLFGFSQKTKVSGRVVDLKTNEPLPFVNLCFKNSKIGCTSNVDGFFSLETYYATDSLIASFVGYQQKAKKVKKDREQVIDFYMEQNSIHLNEVVIQYDRKKDKNPAHELLKRTITHKKANNREKLNAYQYEVYNKVEFDINNIDEEYQNKKIFKPFQFIFENIDTTESKPYLPIFITEAISDFYYRKTPKSEHETIKATKVSGVKNESVQQFLGDMYQNVNIYENYINVFGKDFVSPIADFGLVTYRYYLVDSALIDNKWCYKMNFTPRRQHELTFEGEMWISDTTYAVKQIQATVSGNANINFIHDFAVYQEYNEVEKEVWMLTKDELVVDFAITKKTMGFYGRKTSTYKDFIINSPNSIKISDAIGNISVVDSAGQRDQSYWDENRHVKLSEKEQKIYAMIDTLQEVPAFKSYMDILQLVFLGYKIWGKVELGPYFSTYSFNQIEGHRLRVGGRTSNDFSTRLLLEGYLAYGLKDQRFKYGGGFKYFLSKKPRQSISGSYAYDVEQLGIGDNAWRQDNIVSSIFRRTPFDKLSGYEQFSVAFNREWMQGLSNKITFSHKDIWALGSLQFLDPVSNSNISQISTSEISLYGRFAYKEKYISGEFERTSLGTKYPTIQALYTYGIPNLFDSDFEYHKLKLNVKDKIRLGSLGSSDFIVETGKIWGNLPFPLLQLHNGNETYANDEAAFNLMNYYEFVSDEYASFSLTHHFNGLLFNKIPYLNKLKWREVITAKGVSGRLNEKNKELMIFPASLSVLNRPYYEAGMGIENIFQLLRVDLLWRLAYINQNYITNYESVSSSRIPKWGIRAMLQFKIK